MTYLALFILALVFYAFKKNKSNDMEPNVSNDDDDDGENNDSGGDQQQKSSSVAEELICPITLELPLDPVTAEDGQVYERAAITKHFQVQGGGTEIKSPFTHEPMGKTLTNATRHKNTIEILINDGVITGELADMWTMKYELLEKAQEGDVRAMWVLGSNYYFGKGGYVQNYAMAFPWLDKAHKGGSVKATALVGKSLLEGRGIQKNELLGRTLTLFAAHEGSDCAACTLGCAYLGGKFGFPVDNQKARTWLERSLSSECKYKHLSKCCKKSTRKMLESMA